MSPTFQVEKTNAASSTRPLRLEGGPVHPQGAVLGLGPFGRDQKEDIWGPEWAFAFFVLEWDFLCVLFQQREQGEGPKWA